MTGQFPRAVSTTSNEYTVAILELAPDSTGITPDRVPATLLHPHLFSL